MYRDVGENGEALACFRRAYDGAPTNYQVRLKLAGALVAANLHSEAETHYRWCLARQPTNKQLRETLRNASKLRLAQRACATRQIRGLTSVLPAARSAESAAALVSPSLPNSQPE
jgi:thioredoxin-like negative regulator of GroEL